MYTHKWCCLKHIAKSKDHEGYYVMLNEREYGAYFLTGAELEEWEADFAEIEAFEARLFNESVFSDFEEIFEDLTLPDGPYSGQPTGYYINFNTDSADKPNHLVHPNYIKWTERMKADPRIHQFRSPFWVE